MNEANRWNRWEWCSYRVSAGGMRQEGRSWWLSLDRDYMADSGCLGRLVILGRAFEVYRPMKEQGITSAGPAQ